MKKKINDKFVEDKVNKKGDKLSGVLDFENTDTYDALRKYRTLDDKTFRATFGIDTTKSAVIEIWDNDNEILKGRLEICDDGSIKNAMTKNYLAEVKSGTWTPTMENATVNYTMRIGNYVKIGDVVFIRFSLRGDITTVLGPSYSIISGLPNYHSLYPTFGISLNEQADCLTYGSTQYNPADVYNEGTRDIIQIQRADKGGTWANAWKVCSSFYLSGAGFYFLQPDNSHSSDIGTN